MKKVTRPKYRNLEVVTVLREGRLDIYLRYPGGNAYYLMSRSFDKTIYVLLKNGERVDNVRRFKPSKNKLSQKKFHVFSHLLKVIDQYIQFEFAA